MTKRGGFSLRARGHNIADFHLTIGDDDPINEQFDQLSALRKGQRIQCRPKTAAKSFDAVGERGHIDLLVCLRLQLAQLMC
jgi:hypothetical protein